MSTRPRSGRSRTVCLMGRRKNNPELVQELIDRRWDASMSHEEFDEKYSSLSSSDMARVSDAIDGMEAEAGLTSECDEGCLYEAGGIYCPECHRGD